MPFKPKGRDSKQAIRKQMTDSPDLLIGAFHRGKMVGIVIGSFDKRMKGWINRLAVDPEYRRQKIAWRLVKEAEGALGKHGVMVFCALIEMPNEGSSRLFQKLGYRVHQDISYFSKRKSKHA